LPSVPTSRATRVTSDAKERSWSDHRVDGFLQLQNLAPHVDRDLARQSPFATAIVTIGDICALGR